MCETPPLSSPAKSLPLQFSVPHHLVSPVLSFRSDTSPMDSPSDISDFSDEETIPKVVLSRDSKPDITAELPPVLRKIRGKSSSPPKVLNGGRSSPISPLSSPRSSSPRNSSPRNSPAPSPRGVRKFLNRVS